MASFNIHMAVATKYGEKNNLSENETLDLLTRTIAPDLAKDDKKSHYTGYRDKTKIFEYLENKVNLYLYLKDNEIDTYYDKGVFLHLITDYIFFKDFFDKDYLKNITYEEFCKDLYYSYDYVDKYLKEKYNLNTELYKRQIEENISKDCNEKDFHYEERKNILPFDKLEIFINRVSDIDIEKYKVKIKKAKMNILP